MNYRADFIGLPKAEKLNTVDINDDIIHAKHSAGESVHPIKGQRTARPYFVPLFTRDSY